MSNQQMPPVKLAFVIDGKVLDVLHTDDRLAAIFLSEPEIIDVTDTYASVNTGDTIVSLVNWTYDGEKFTPPTE